METLPKITGPSHTFSPVPGCSVETMLKDVKKRPMTMTKVHLMHYLLIWTLVVFVLANMNT